MVKLMLSCLLDSEVLKGTSYSSSVSVLYIVSSQQILANQMEAVSIWYMKHIVLAGGGIKIWSTCKASWKNAQYMVGPIWEAPQEQRCSL